MLYLLCEITIYRYRITIYQCRITVYWYGRTNTNQYALYQFVPTSVGLTAFPHCLIGFSITLHALTHSLSPPGISAVAQDTSLSGLLSVAQYTGLSDRRCVCRTIHQ